MMASREGPPPPPRRGWWMRVAASRTARRITAFLAAAMMTDVSRYLALVRPGGRCVGDRGRGGRTRGMGWGRAGEALRTLPGLLWYVLSISLS